MTVAARWTVPQTWWIASELCRRNASLRIRQQVERNTAQMLVEPDSVPEGRGELLLFDEEHGIRIDGQWTRWDDVFASDDPHFMVKRIEAELGWKLPAASATTPRSLTYRAIARMSALRVNDRVQPGFVPWTRLGETPHDRSWLSLFDGVRALLPPYGRPQQIPLWVMFLGHPRGAMVLAENGVVYRRKRPPLPLMPRYLLRRNVDDVIAALPGDAHITGGS
ncbi:hypothetical protein [Curtobacterium sp. MCBD17_040]|uniref:TY-Chap2 family putative peptide chaperone n=1 Tax=Curtobacterium sp. MCBD17_040 TaxID=2175674 RepID=UPI000DA70866|nr:hypothetical protein [Curtobacterium sp. MCBD17_040]WIB65838.1 hypothetical protein DEI94_17135 [Curtobacterium sp. MCBD17_040]